MSRRNSPEANRAPDSPAPDREAYLKGRRRASLPVYFRDEAAKLRAQEKAAQMGYASCSAWLLQMVETATSGQVYPPEYVEDLRRELERLRGWVEQKDDQITSLRKDLRVVEMQKDDLYTVLAGLASPETRARVAERARAKGVEA